MELNRDQIIKALECCASRKQACRNCPVPQDVKDDCRCMEFISRNVLALIRELTTEVADAEAEAEKAIDIAEGNIRAEIASGGTSCHWCEDKVRADTVRKMQERFNQVFVGMDVTNALLRRTFDQIAKEVLEETK